MDQEQLDTVRQCQAGGKSLCSAIVDNMWCISIGVSEKNIQKMNAWIRLCYLPSNARNVTMQHVVKCEQIEPSAWYSNAQNNYSMSTQAKWTGLRFSLENIKKCDELKITADIEIVAMGIDESQADSLVISDFSQITHMLLT